MTATVLAGRVLDRWPERNALGLAIGAAAALGAVAGAGGPLALAGLAAVLLFVVVAAQPAVAAYLYVAAVPFAAGIERGVLIPVFRPNEGLQFFLLAAVVTGALLRVARDETPRIRLVPLDGALLVLASLGSFWPLASALVRGVALSGADFMASVTLWKYLALYAMFRVALRDREELRRCLWVLLVAAAGLAAIALTQSLGLFGVEAMLSKLWEVPDSPFTGRGTATLGNAIAVGDYLAYSLALVLAWYVRRPDDRRLLLPLGVVLLAGLLGTGQFSSWIAGGIVVTALLSRERHLARLVVRAVPVLGLGVVALWPVIAKRLVEFGSGGLPYSWVVRWDNLAHFYLPDLAGLGFVFGVRPDNVVLAPETWRDEIFLESGHLALLWAGGIPLLLAFFWFVRVAMRHARGVAAERDDEIGIVAVACWASLWAMAVLTLFDIHLTLRGGADLLFILLGLSAGGMAAARAPAPARQESP